MVGWGRGDVYFVDVIGSAGDTASTVNVGGACCSTHTRFRRLRAAKGLLAAEGDVVLWCLAWSFSLASSLDAKSFMPAITGNAK